MGKRDGTPTRRRMNVCAEAGIYLWCTKPFHKSTMIKESYGHLGCNTFPAKGVATPKLAVHHLTVMLTARKLVRKFHRSC